MVCQLQAQTTMNNPYASQWTQIDSLDREGLYRSALDAVKALHAQAGVDKQTAQEVKALIYWAKFEQQLNEDGDVASIKTFEAELAKASFPMKPVLQSILAELYHRHHTFNQWQIGTRTAIAGGAGDDIKQWTSADFARKSTSLYLASLEDLRTRQVAISDFAAILSGGLNTEGLRPTLYDFLAHRAISHFAYENAYIADPVYAFSLTQAEAFAPVGVFTTYNFPSQDTSSFVYRSLQVFQELLRWRLAEAQRQPDNQGAALLDADLRRLEFVRQQSSHPNKEQLYKAALDQLMASLGTNSPAKAKVQLAIANWLYEQGNMYTEEMGDNPLRWAWRDAANLCTAIERDYPNSVAASQAVVLLARIRAGNLSVSVESASLPGQPGLVSLEYANQPQAFLRIVSLTDAEYLQSEQGNHDQWIRLLESHRPLQRWSVTLPNPGDYRSHRTETKFDALPLGKYALLVSGTDNFKAGESQAILFWVTRLGLVYSLSPDAGFEATVVDRWTGEPLLGVSATIFTPRSLGDGWRETGKTTSDANGFFTIDQTNRQNSFRLRLTKGKDTFYPLDNFYNYYYRNQPENQEMTTFFLDRGIYRPGQTVHFKALLLQLDQHQTPALLAGRKVTITFLDANGQEVAKQELVSNAYGSVTGSFKAPEGKLLGGMTLLSSVGSSSHYFLVEEYKRPRFEVTFEALTGEAKLGAAIRVSGKALGYAGPAVAEAQVTYTVTRSVRFPWFSAWGRWGGPGYNPNRSDLIATGKTTTDAQGNFSIDFTASPDDISARNQHPVFVFDIQADVTDVTGETHSANKSIQLGYTPILATLTAPEQLDNSMPLTVQISTKNLDNKPLAVDGKLTIRRLEHPQQFLVYRQWGVPDQPIIPEKEFKRAFPHIAYQTEDDRKNWPLAETRYESTLNTGTSDSLSIAVGNWPAGYYAIDFQIITEDGDTLNTRQYLQLQSQQSLPAGTILHTGNLRKAYQPGEEIKMNFGTSQGQTYVMAELFRRQGSIKRQWLKVGPQAALSHEVAETDRGNLALTMTYVRFNRVFSNQQIIPVPWSNKDLSISMETFRDKLRPGEPEEWIVRIDGPQKEQVAAELAASMYDASLDQLTPFSWSFSPYPLLGYAPATWSGIGFDAEGTSFYFPLPPTPTPAEVSYQDLNWFGFAPVYVNGGLYKSMARSAPGHVMEADVAYSISPAAPPAPEAQAQTAVPDYAPVVEAKPSIPQPIRTNLQETAFFFPQMQTDAQGRVVLRFKAPEALTRWKLQLLGHTTDLQYSLTQREVVTQKELMVLPNAPRFLREGDAIDFTAKVSNLTDKPVVGEAILEIVDASNEASILVSRQNFQTAANASAGLSWKVNVPMGSTGAWIYRVRVQTDNFADGEEGILPVLTNRTLVTETLPLHVRGRQSRSFTLLPLARSAGSTSIESKAFTLEITSNPAWIAVKSLPYLMEYPYECTEQILNRFYANSLSASITGKYPRIRAVFDSWKGDPNALKSPLATNQSLKSALLEETPWVLESKDETAQRERIGLLFDLNQLAKSRTEALDQLVARQSPDGGFAWFPGGIQNWYVTQYVVEGLAHLRQLGVEDFRNEPQVNQLLNRAITYTDQAVVKYYNDLAREVERKQTTFEADHLESIIIHYLYTRSFFPEQVREEPLAKVWNYYLGQAEKYWLSRGLYEQGMIALALFRSGKAAQAQRILASLRERALRSDELGMYWKTTAGWHWNQLPIETHSLLIEVFHVLGAPAAEVDELRLWLLKNKETNRWETTKATAAAVYALLSTGESWLTESQPVEVSFPKANAAQYSSQLRSAQASAEAGTGYYQAVWAGDQAGPQLAEVKLSNPNKTVAWGGMYWQYLEDIDKVQAHAESPLKLERTIFRERQTDAGKVLEAITEGSLLEPGDKLVVRLVVSTDRDMEFVHLKDLRGSGLEPVNQLSNYRWQDGLGYYQSATDLGMNFFFDYFPKGTYVLEHSLWVVHRGEFSNGLATLQSMYAPAFSSHSAGTRLRVR